MYPVNKRPPSYPISSKSRSKLNNFRYNDQDETSSEKPSLKPQAGSEHTDKENQSSWLNGVVAPAQPELDQRPSSSGAAESKVVKECPQTPGNRIPLADLIGNVEDAINQAPGQEYTPEDYVIWQHVPASSNTGTMSQTPATNKKKRRRNSSPGSSPLAGNSKSARKGSFDLQSFQAVLKTPQNDIAADLWNNYVGKATANGNGEIPQIRFQNLLSSSPQTPATGRTSRDSSGLRRATSCNVEWPSSKAKRRKLDFSRSKSNVIDAGTSSSNINRLMERIEKSLRKTPMPQADSSPVPKREEVRRSRSTSPVERKQPLKDLGSPGQETKTGDSCIRPIATEPVKVSSSDFGDDDLDQDFLDLAEAAMDPFVDSDGVNDDEQVAKPNGLPHLSPVKAPAASGGQVNSHVDTTMAEKSDYKYDADEFDDDFEEFSDNIEDILAECDGTPSTKLARSVSNNNPVSQPLSSGHDAKPLFAVAADQVFGDVKNPEATSSGDEFDDEDFDMEAIEQSMKQTAEGGPDDKFRGREAIKRYLIIDIADSTYTTHNGRIQPEQVLLVQDERTKCKKVVILRESWFDSPCNKDFYIHLIGDFDAQGQCIVTNSQNMIILHPDHLVSATVVADSVSCQRRAVLQDRIKNTGDIGKPRVFGNIFHEIFQEALKINKWDDISLRSLIDTVTQNHIEELYLIGMSLAEAVEYAMGRMPELKTWAELFLRTKPGAKSLVEDRGSTKLNLSISKLLEVEEHVWSPMYGLKGNIDATVQVACRDEGRDKNLIVPLELKTGKRDTNQAHRAQTALYTLLLSDRYDLDVTFGLLYYLETSKMLRIRGIRHELLQMIQQRNRLVGYMRNRTELPPMIKKQSLCTRCYAKTPCFIYHKLADNGDGETSGLGDEFVNSMDHLTPQHRDFFQKWDDLLTKEEQNMMKFKRELWTLLSHEREALGRCFGNVVIEPGSAVEDKDGIKINRYRYTFNKRHPVPAFSFAESQLTVGEPVVVSDEKGHFALANGYVVQVSPKRITVAVDRRLHNARTKAEGFNSETNQTFKGIMEVLEEGAIPSTARPLEPEEETLYRLDKDEFSNGMAIVRSNLISMMEKNLFQAKHLRRLIVEREAPTFKPAPSIYKMSKADRASLNVDQERAINKVMSAQDYALVLGMPGTGKTTTIAHIIRALVSQGKSVLLTSYTHTAVDNILLKIRNDGIRTLRIGATTKVHPEVQDFADLAATPKKTIEELKASYEDSQVVATTCLGVGHDIFTQRIFDYCIVDEASQITLPVCLGPIRMAKTFILVGDHYQLPPLVQNAEAREGGLDVSLFKLLSDTHPSSVVNLEHQYRMCEDIMLLSNTLIYSGQLKCGTPEVAASSLEIPDISGLKQHHIDHLPRSASQKQLCLGTSQGRCWLRDLIRPSAKTRFINTDTLTLPALEVTNGSRIVNPTEATLCSQLVEAFISCGIPARSIGVITFYRSQLAILKQNLRHHMPDLEMHTADKFQGRDKEIVILSCVRSNADNHLGELLRDWRRVNVAFTRARTKLLVIGSKNTLRDGNELLARYINLVQKRGWVYDLPKGAEESHIFEYDNGFSTQLSEYKEDKSTPSPKGSPSQNRMARNPLSPVQARQSNGLRKPAKKGAKLLSGSKVLGNRPVLQDVVNDLVG